MMTICVGTNQTDWEFSPKKEKYTHCSLESLESIVLKNGMCHSVSEKLRVKTCIVGVTTVFEIH